VQWIRWELKLKSLSECRECIPSRRCLEMGEVGMGFGKGGRGFGLSGKNLTRKNRGEELGSRSEADLLSEPTF
jgi:hypothetical protein